MQFGLSMLRSKEPTPLVCKPRNGRSRYMIRYLLLSRLYIKRSASAYCLRGDHQISISPGMAMPESIEQIDVLPSPHERKQDRGTTRVAKFGSLCIEFSPSRYGVRSQKSSRSLYEDADHHGICKVINLYQENHRSDDCRLSRTFEESVSKPI